MMKESVFISHYNIGNTIILLIVILTVPHLKSPMHKAIRYGQENMNALVLCAIAH